MRRIKNHKINHKMKTKITQQDYIKAFRKASREQEIEAHQKQVFQRFNVHQSKKIYNRKKAKANDKNLPYFFSNLFTSHLFFFFVIAIAACAAMTGWGFIVPSIMLWS